jgi:hypothetical protein
MSTIAPHNSSEEAVSYTQGENEGRSTSLASSPRSQGSQVNHTHSKKGCNERGNQGSMQGRKLQGQGQENKKGGARPLRIPNTLQSSVLPHGNERGKFSYLSYFTTHPIFRFILSVDLSMILSRFSCVVVGLCTLGRESGF